MSFHNFNGMHYFRSNFEADKREYKGNTEKCLQKTLQTIKKRNAQILKVLLHFIYFKCYSSQTCILKYFPQEIEMSRARIRFSSIYSPLETVLQRAVSDYVRVLNGCRKN